MLFGTFKIFCEKLFSCKKVESFNDNKDNAQFFDIFPIEANILSSP